MRIQTGKLYAIKQDKGISGFQDWNHFYLRVVTAKTARVCRDLHPDCVLFEFDARIHFGTYRLDDGHLPDYQPRTDSFGVVRFLNANPDISAYLIDVCEYGPNGTFCCGTDCWREPADS